MRARMLLTLAFVLSVAAVASASPPAGYPYRISGEVKNFATQVVYPWSLQWSDERGGYYWLLEGSGAEVVLAPDGSGGLVDSSGVVSLYPSVPEVGGLLISAADFGPLVMMLQDFDYGYGTEVEPTVVLVCGGIAAGLFLAGFLAVLETLIGGVRRFGFL
jgi:hypothetical protein